MVNFEAFIPNSFTVVLEMGIYTFFTNKWLMLEIYNYPIFRNLKISLNLENHSN